jgi:5'-3' exonuclease
LPNLKKKLNKIFTIQINELEADEIIGIITLNFNNNKIIIFSEDSDFFQLGKNNVEFLSFKNKNKRIISVIKNTI